MRKKSTWFGMTGILVLAVLLGAFSQSGEDLFQKALRLERNEGRLMEAIELYNRVVAERGIEAIAAQAQLRIGLCYEMLGKAEAIKAYELVLEKYSVHKEPVAVARLRLAELKKEGPKELTVIKTEFHMHEPFGISPDGTKIVGVQISKGQNIVVNHLGKEGLDYITNFEWGDEYYWTCNPVWSPDGEEIAYLASYSGKKGKSDNNLRVTSLDGRTRILIRSETDWFTSYAWMPDGASILTVKGDKENKQELGLVPSEGGEFKKLVSLKGQVEAFGRGRPTACISPDGQFIVYTDILPGEESELFITTSDGKTPWPLAPNPASDRIPRWSPDGKHIVFLSNRHGDWALWGVAVKHGKPAGDPFLIREGMGNNFFGNWTRYGLVSWNWIRMRNIYLLNVNPETGEPAGKPKLLDYLPAGSNNFPAFAPEGNRLAFIRRDSAARKHYLVVTQREKDDTMEFELPDGTLPRKISWMPDGRGIGIYCINTSEENIFIRLYFETGNWEIHPLPNVEDWTTTDFDGSGKAILYGKNGLIGDGAGIIQRNLETGEERYVFRPKQGTRVNFRFLKCSRDYKKIAFLETNTALTIAELETGESRVLSSNGLFFPCWSPDGKRLMSAGRLPKKKGEFLSLFSLDQRSVEEYDLSIGMPRNSRIMRPDWSADGTQVAYILMRNKSEHLIYKNIIPKDK